VPRGARDLTHVKLSEPPGEGGRVALLDVGQTSYNVAPLPGVCVVSRAGPPSLAPTYPRKGWHAPSFRVASSGCRCSCGCRLLVCVAWRMRRKLLRQQKEGAPPRRTPQAGKQRFYEYVNATIENGYDSVDGFKRMPKCKDSSSFSGSLTW
jgi:hypothetical protein